MISTTNEAFYFCFWIKSTNRFKINEIKSSRCQLAASANILTMNNEQSHRTIDFYSTERMAIAYQETNVKRHHIDRRQTIESMNMKSEKENHHWTKPDHFWLALALFHKVANRMQFVMLIIQSSSAFFHFSQTPSSSINYTIIRQYIY